MTKKDREDIERVVRSLKLRAVIYARVSTDKQEEDGTSLGTQLENCRVHANEKEYSVIEEIEESFTGSLLWERKKLMKIFAMARNGEFDVLIVDTIDRLTRDKDHLVIIIEEMKHLGIRVEFVRDKVDESPTGEFVRYTYGFLAQMERLKIIERTDTGRRKRVTEKGKIIPGWKPRYGYVWAGDKKDDKQRMDLNVEELEVVKRIFQMYVYEGMSCRKVGMTLDAEGIPSPTGKAVWNESTIRRILSDPTYIGKGGCYKYASIREKGGYSARRKDPSEWLTAAEGAYPAIVDEDTFNKAQVKLVLNKVESSRNNPEAKSALLRCGFVKCGYCKRVMCATRSIGGNFDPDRHNKSYSYKCGWRYRGNSRCERACSISVDELDAAVWNYVGEVLEDFSLVKQAVELAAKNNSGKADIQSVIRSIKNAKAAQDEFFSDLNKVDEEGLPRLRGRSRDLVLDQINQLQERIDKLEETRRKLEKGKESWKHIEEEVNSFIEWVLASKDTYQNASYEEKRRALRMLGISVVVYGKSDQSHPERYEIKVSVPSIVRHTA